MLKKKIFNIFHILIISNIGNFCTFGYQIILARSMEIQEYGLFNSLLAYYSLISIPFILIPYTVIKFYNEENSDEYKSLISFLIYFCFFIFISQIILLFFRNNLFFSILFDFPINNPLINPELDPIHIF